MDTFVQILGLARYGQTHHCALVMDSLVQTASWVGSGIGQVQLAGYLVKM